MSAREVAGYFKNTTSSQHRTFGDITNFALTVKDSETISIYYYFEKDKVEDSIAKKAAGKKAIVKIPDFYYKVAKDSL